MSAITSFLGYVVAFVLIVALVVVWGTVLGLLVVLVKLGWWVGLIERPREIER